MDSALKSHDQGSTTVTSSALRSLQKAGRNVVATNALAAKVESRTYSSQSKRVHRGSILEQRVLSQVPDFTCGGSFQLKHNIRDLFLTDDDEVRVYSFLPHPSSCFSVV
jgi:predicted  nucleic acid-binding Zn ribbon protein